MDAAMCPGLVKEFRTAASPPTGPPTPDGYPLTADGNCADGWSSCRGVGNARQANDSTKARFLEVSTAWLPRFLRRHRLEGTPAVVHASQPSRSRTGRAASPTPPALREWDAE